MPRVSKHSSESELVLQVFPCGRDNCDAAFTRSSDRDRHEKRHLPYAKRPFKCDFCDFRANQKSGLKCHENSVHMKKRIPCRDPGCDLDFSDPSTLSRHMSRRHKLSSKKLSRPSWVDFTSKFAIRSDSDPEAPGPVDATASHSRDIPKSSADSNHNTKVERRNPDVSSANITLHTSPVGRQEGSSCQNLLLDSALFSFTPSPSPTSTLSPLLAPAALHQPDWQFQASSSLYPFGPGMDFPSCSSTGLSFPETNLTVMPPCGFQTDIGMPCAYGTPSRPTEQSVDTYFPTLDDFLVQSSTNSSFVMGPNVIHPGPSLMALSPLMTPPSMSNYDATCSGPNLLCEASQSWQVDTPALNFGYDDACGIEYYSTFNGLGFLNF